MCVIMFFFLLTDVDIIVTKEEPPPEDYEVKDCDVELYMATKKILLPLKDTEYFTVAAFIMHLERNKTLARSLATQLISDIRMIFPLFTAQGTKSKSLHNFNGGFLCLVFMMCLKLAALPT